MAEVICKINESLEGLLYPIEKLRSLPGNPRKGNVGAVRDSYREFGQQKPIIARHDEEDPEVGIVLAGNTQLAASKELEWTHIAVVWSDEWDDKKAKAFALADNRTHDLGEYDEEALLDMMMDVVDDDVLFDATGYDEDFLAELTEMSFDEPDDGWGDTSASEDDDVDEEPEEKADRVAPKPVIQYQIIFDNEEQQQIWYSFVRWLKKNQDGDSIGERLTSYVAGSLEE